MSVAIVQGCSKGFGQALTRALLAKTKLHIVGTTSSGADRARQAILSSESTQDESSSAGPSETGYGGRTSGGYGGADNTGAGADKVLNDKQPSSSSGGSKDWEGRLTTLDMDVRDEGAIEKAASEVKKRFGDNEVRLLVNVSGVLHAEKNLAAISYEKMVETFTVNTFGHMMVYKHFCPLLPNKKQIEDGKEDPAQGVIKTGTSALVSLSARVGSIGDNARGGWYSYRSSKAALNQVVRTLSLELARRSPNHPALCIAYHPGTVQTGLSQPYTSGQSPSDTKGLFTAEEAADNLIKVLSGLKDDMSGGFWAYDGSQIKW